MSLCHGWGLNYNQTSSRINIRHIQSVWAHWYAVHWHIAVATSVCANNTTMVTTLVEQQKRHQSNVGFGWQCQQNNGEDVSTMRVIDAYTKRQHRHKRNKGKDATAIRVTTPVQQQWRSQWVQRGQQWQHNKGKDPSTRMAKMPVQWWQRHQQSNSKDTIKTMVHHK